MAQARLCGRPAAYWVTVSVDGGAGERYPRCWRHVEQIKTNSPGWLKDGPRYELLGLELIPTGAPPAGPCTASTRILTGQKRIERLPTPSALPPTPNAPPRASVGAYSSETVPRSAEFPADLGAYETRLHETFGFSSFRGGQSQVLSALGNANVVAVMPTGSGKSLCYVLPALEMGRTIVVSPLIALMQDQVESLQSAGINATFINSTIDGAEQDRRYRDFVEGRVPLLYVAPERLANQRFLDGLARADVHLFAIDEAHCISAWGHSFRPDYLQLGAVRERLGRPRTLALTATATPPVRLDIATRLGIADDCQYVSTSVDRPNLTYAVHTVNTTDARQRWVIRWVSERQELSGIIYARTRKGTEEMAIALRGNGINAEAYHAGLPDHERARIQHAFTDGRLSVIVATMAFGMGIDKPDVRYVVHMDMPGRLEAYYQESGRAGRDGMPSECVLLYGTQDRESQEYFINRAHPSDGDLREAWNDLLEKADRRDGSLPLDVAQWDGWAMTLVAFRESGLLANDALRLTSFDADAPIDSSAVREHRAYEEERLQDVISYAEAPGCRRAAILRYFGETPGGSCGRCDNCRRPSTLRHGIGRRIEISSPPKASPPTRRRFAVGDLVTHDHYGAGVITRVESTDGVEFVTVRFSSGRPRRFDVRIANLRRRL